MWSAIPNVCANHAKSVNRYCVNPSRRQLIYHLHVNIVAIPMDQSTTSQVQLVLLVHWDLVVLCPALAAVSILSANPQRDAIHVVPLVVADLVVRYYPDVVVVDLVKDYFVGDFTHSLFFLH